MIYEQWLKEWLENFVKPTSKPKTYLRYSEIVDCHICRGLGSYELDELTPLVLQKFTTDLLKRGNVKTGGGLSANSVNAVITVIQNSLKSACAIGQTSGYVADKIKRTKVSGGKPNCFTLKEQKKIEKYALAPCARNMAGVVVCLYTGLRIGELLALEWRDVDFSSGMLAVNRTCYDGKDVCGKFTRITGTPKTLNSVRIIPLPQKVTALLKQIKASAVSSYVVSSRSGGPVSVRSYQKSFSAFLTRINVPHRGFHALRHTFATRALECGMDVKTLSEILGHKSAGITLDRYVHSFAEHKKHMMDRLGKMI